VDLRPADHRLCDARPDFGRLASSPTWPEGEVVDRLLMPVSGTAGTASWPGSRSLFKSLQPMRPAPAMIASRMIDAPFGREPREATERVRGRASCRCLPASATDSDV
jgi:hypothetical protein